MFRSDGGSSGCNALLRSAVVDPLLDMLGAKRISDSEDSVTHRFDKPSPPEPSEISVQVSTSSG